MIPIRKYTLHVNSGYQFIKRNLLLLNNSADVWLLTQDDVYSNLDK